MNYNDWVKPYRDIIDTQYKLDETGKQEFDAFFVRVGEFAAGCSDQTAFTTQFTQSALYQEYTQLMQKYQKFVVTATGQTVEDITAEQQSVSGKGMAGEYAKSMAKQELNRAVSQALPDEVNRLRWGGLRVIPVIGPIVQWIDNIKWLRNLFGGKKE